MTDKIKPCPFCGCKMYVEAYEADRNGTFYYMRPVDDHSETCPLYTAIMDDCADEDETIRRWNRRF